MTVTNYNLIKYNFAFNSVIYEMNYVHLHLFFLTTCFADLFGKTSKSCSDRYLSLIKFELIPLVLTKSF